MWLEKAKKSTVGAMHIKNSLMRGATHGLISNHQRRKAIRAISLTPAGLVVRVFLANVPALDAVPGVCYGISSYLGRWGMGWSQFRPDCLPVVRAHLLSSHRPACERLNRSHVTHGHWLVTADPPCYLRRLDV